MLMPTLPPRLRIRLRIAVPWVRIWRGRVDSAMMLSGTWVQVAVEKRALVGGYRVHGEKIEAEPRDRRLDPDLARMEPVLQLAPVEHQLQGADPQAQGQESDEIERLAMHVAGLADENENAQRAQHADRQVDVEDPAPAVVIGQPAAERRPHDRSEDRPDAEYR